MKVDKNGWIILTEWLFNRGQKAEDRLNVNDMEGGILAAHLGIIRLNCNDVDGDGNEDDET